MSVFGRLRAIGLDELETIRVWRNAPNVRANMYTQQEISREEHLAWWENSAKLPENLYLMYENGGRALGVVYFNRMDRVNRNAAWGFYASPCAPKGTGSKMEFLALDYAFGELKLYKIYCEVLSYNSAVIKLHNKFGFSQEGVFKEQFRCGEEYVDIHRFGLLSIDWLDIRLQMESRILMLEKANGISKG